MIDEQDGGLDPTRDPQKPGPRRQPGDERQPPPSSIEDSGTAGGGVAGTPGPAGGRAPDEKGGGAEPS